MINENILVLTIKEWNIDNFYELKKNLSSQYNLYLISEKKEATFENILKINPRFIFIPHWSWKINEKIYNSFETVIFHETDLPFGRGGSPIQNLISKKIYDTKISAIKCEEELDSGDIYLQESINLSEGSAQEIFLKISEIIFLKMIPKIVLGEYKLRKQEGKVVIFERRKPENSNLELYKDLRLEDLYDLIRMVDAQGYPKAYLQMANMKIEFSSVDKESNKLVGRFEIIENK